MFLSVSVDTLPSLLKPRFGLGALERGREKLGHSLDGKEHVNAVGGWQSYKIGLQVF